MSDVIIYTTEDGTTKIDLRLDNGTVWLSQLEIAELFQTTKQNISKHIQAIFDDQELNEKATVNHQLTVQKEGEREVSRSITLYNLDVILAVGYRVRSVRGVQFRRYASTVLKEYLEKGFALNDERLKNLGGGNYWKELLGRIRDIRSSEKVMYRQVLDLYATATDYTPDSEQSLTFFKIVQNKLHYAAHGHTASEIIYLRVDSDKPFAGLSNFKGSQPTQADAMIAKNYLSEQELRVLNNLVPDPAAIEKEADKKAFAKLFGEYLRVENVLQNYDEFASLKALQGLDMVDAAAVDAFKAKHYLSDEDLVALQAITLPAERKIQDYRSTYNDVRDWLRREKSSAEKEKSTIDWDDVVFEVDLLKSQEINLDYILALIFEHNKKTKSKSDLVNEVRRVIRGSLGNRAKENLLVDFINQTDLDKIGDKASVIDAFFTFAQAEQQREAQELISAENLNADAARRYISTSLKREFASDSGTELNAVLPKMSPLNPQYLTKKQSVFQKIAAFVEKFKGVGGVI